MYVYIVEDCLYSVLFCSFGLCFVLRCLLTQCQAESEGNFMTYFIRGFGKFSLITYVNICWVFAVFVFVLIHVRGLSAAAQMFTNLFTRFRANNIQSKYQVAHAISNCKSYN